MPQTPLNKPLYMTHALQCTCTTVHVNCEEQNDTVKITTEAAKILFLIQSIMLNQTKKGTQVQDAFLGGQEGMREFK